MEFSIVGSEEFMAFDIHLLDFVLFSITIHILVFGPFETNWKCWGYWNFFQFDVNYISIRLLTHLNVMHWVPNIPIHQENLLDKHFQSNVALLSDIGPIYFQIFWVIDQNKILESWGSRNHTIPVFPL